MILRLISCYTSVVQYYVQLELVWQVRPCNSMLEWITHLTCFLCNAAKCAIHKVFIEYHIILS